MQTLNTISQFETIKVQEMGFVLYITDNMCSVGENVAPKLESLIETAFPKMKLFQVFNSELPELSAQLQVFVVPTILVFFDGKLYIQKSRSFSLHELQHEIARYYKMVFPEA